MLELHVWHVLALSDSNSDACDDGLVCLDFDLLTTWGTVESVERLIVFSCSRHTAFE